MKRLLALAAFSFFAGAAPARIFLPYDAELQGLPYSAYVVLPDFFGTLQFGIWDETAHFIAAQREHPVDEKIVEDVLWTAQVRLIEHYVATGELRKEFIGTEDFQQYLLAETLLDPRCAIVVITARNDITDIRAMLRACSRLYRNELGLRDPLLLLPHEIRGILSPEFRAWRGALPPPEVNLETYEEPMKFISSQAETDASLYLGAVHWMTGTSMELKSWVHRPARLPRRLGRRRSGGSRLQDFIPMLVRLGQMHKIFSWTGMPASSLRGGAKDASTQASLDQMLEVVSRILRRPARLADIGIRADEYRLVTTDLETRETYREVFGAEPRFDWNDPHLKDRDGRPIRMHVSFAERRVFDQRLSSYLATRPGARFLPASRLFFQQPMVAGFGETCVNTLMRAGVDTNRYEILGSHLGHMGSHGRPMPW